MAYKKRYVAALCKELELRKDYLGTNHIKTIYFGGGTPSSLGKEDLECIFSCMDNLYDLSDCVEVTLEANPDDLSEDYVLSLSNLPINRISMGIQSFNNDMLVILGRRHDSQTALDAIRKCKKHGFHELSIDLMYGLPGQTLTDWDNDITQALSLEVPHISAYLLSYEKDTPLYKLRSAHKIRETDPDLTPEYFHLLVDRLTSAGYIHYEISNFALEGHESRHNSSYWNGTPYMGCGAGAHSFNGVDTREWNVDSIRRYIQGMENNKRVYSYETLNAQERYNEYIITGLRRSKGISLNRLQSLFGEHRLHYCMGVAKKYIESELLEIKDNHLKLTYKGIFVSDGIMANLMCD